MDLTPSTITSQLEQVLYIAAIDSSEITVSSSTPTMTEPLPPAPDFISEELTTQIYSLPLSKSFLDTVHQSMNDQSDAWKELLSHEVTYNNDNVSLPWRGEDQGEVRLEDLVLLKLISPNSLSVYVDSSLNDLLKSLPILMMSDVLMESKSVPLCLIHDETNLISQANIYSFHDALDSLTNVS